jgi:hypothetical protein
VTSATLPASRPVPAVLMDLLSPRVRAPRADVAGAYPGR